MKLKGLVDWYFGLGMLSQTLMVSALLASGIAFVVLFPKTTLVLTAIFVFLICGWLIAMAIKECDPKKYHRNRK
jgi:cytochrome c biogenesis factor